MKVFNLADFQKNNETEFVKNYVEAMGYTRQKNRDPYRWWDYEELASSSPENWRDWVTSDPSLGDLLKDAGSFRRRSLSKLQEIYCLTMAEAGNLVKTYIGYHPSYGGYICQIGPYISSGFQSGNIITEAVDKFYYYILRRRRSTADEIAKSVLKNIRKYHSNFGVDFNEGDFALVVKSPSEEVDLEKKRQKKEKSFVNNLDPDSSESRNFFERAPMIGEGSQIVLNTRGYDKLLRAIMGPWYLRTIMEKSIQDGISQDRVMMNILSDPATLRQIYNRTYQKWEEARNSGEAAALGMTPPPKFTDSSLQSKSGAQGFTGVLYNDKMANQIRLRAEIIEALNNGINEPQEIANRLNSSDARRSENERRRKRRDSSGNPLEPIIISEEEVMRQLGEIDKMRTEGKDNDTILNESRSLAESMITQRGYDDFQTAFDMASLYLSSQTEDPVTGALQGGGDPVFSVLKNFENHTTQELARLRAECIAKKTGQEITEQAKEPGKAPATPEEIAKDIGKAKTKKTKPVEPVAVEPQPSKEEAEEELESLIGKTLKNLVKIAGELDDEGKGEAAEEVHKVIRKYQERI